MKLDIRKQKERETNRQTFLTKGGDLFAKNVVSLIVPSLPLHLFSSHPGGSTSKSIRGNAVSSAFPTDLGGTSLTTKFK